MEGFVEDQCPAGIIGGGGNNNHLGGVDERDGGRRGVGNDVAAVYPENICIGWDGMGSEIEENEGAGRHGREKRVGSMDYIDEGGKNK